MKIDRQKVIPVAAGALAILAFHLIMRDFFPNAHGYIGSDYSMFLPRMLMGYYWYQTNGIFAAPWFTPSICGGLPLYANPQSVYYSLPQILTIFTDPLSSVYITVIMFGAAGFFGSYIYLRDSFRVSMYVAILGGGLFLFCSFYMSRMFVGHLTYHGFMLLPLTLHCISRALTETGTGRWLRLLFDSSLAGLMFGYMIHSGMMQLAFPLALILVMFGILRGMMFGDAKNYWIRLALGGLAGLALGGGKLVAGLSFIGNCPRDFYPFVSLSSLYGLFRTLVQAFIFVPNPHEINQYIINSYFMWERHEFEFNVTVVPFVFIIAGAATWLKNGAWKNFLRCSALDKILILSLVVMFLFPALLNYYPFAHGLGFTKLPILKQSFSFFRWFIVYVPVLIFGAMIMLDRAPFLSRHRTGFAVGGMVVLAISVMLYPRTHYQNESYGYNEIVDAYWKAKNERHIPSVENIGIYWDGNQPVMPVDRDKSFIQGASQLFCYESLFGYRLEKFPMKTLHAGPVFVESDGVFNFKNPACYVYPKENACEPGDHFLASQRTELENFTHYRPIDFKTPLRHKIANVISVVSLILIPIFILVYLFGLSRNCSIAAQSSDEKSPGADNNRPGKKRVK